MLLHYRREIQENREEFIQLLLSTLAAHKGSHATQTVILHVSFFKKIYFLVTNIFFQGIERLILAGSLDEEHLEKLESTAQLLIEQPEPSARKHGYQILITTSFISKKS